LFWDRFIEKTYLDERSDFLPGDYVMLSVGDNGIGMSKEMVKDIFEPFFTTKELGKGTGLGLATVYGIVKQNKGFINVYSEPGSGTIFKVFLPKSESLGKPAIYEPQEDTESHGETILLVEDEESIRKVAQTMLEFSGYKVLPASAPCEALKIAQENPGSISLLITDVAMPEMNGNELSAELQKINPTLKTLFISGYTANVIAHSGVLDKGVFFLQKPFSQKELAGMVRKALRASS
jgi:CheY-like chemotaxis protein